jgi:hypothetical protein
VARHAAIELSQQALQCPLELQRIEARFSIQPHPRRDVTAGAISMNAMQKELSQAAG